MTAEMTIPRTKLWAPRARRVELGREAIRKHQLPGRRARLSAFQPWKGGVYARLTPRHLSHERVTGSLERLPTTKTSNEAETAMRVVDIHPVSG